MGLLITKGAGGILNFTTEYGYEFVYDSIIIALAGGLMLGVPQAVVLGGTPVRWWAWIPATTLGAVLAWVGHLLLLFPLSARGQLPPELDMIAVVGGYWIALTLPQSVLIGLAMKTELSDSGSGLDLRS